MLYYYYYYYLYNIVIVKVDRNRSLGVYRLLHTQLGRSPESDE